MESQTLFERARKTIPGGVNSPVRACLSVGGDPLFIESAMAGRITTVDGQELVDLVMSWGPMLLGHRQRDVEKAVTRAVAKGTSFGAPCEAEVLMAEEIVAALPGVDMARMVNSGTEATMSALRLARGFTGRSKVVKFTGCYHGHADPFLAAAGSGVATLSIPGTPGVPPDTVKDTLLAPYNDLAAVEALFGEHDDIAAVIVEPMAGNMGLVPPTPGFLEGLRTLTSDKGALLIFDEVITGFRLAYGGAQNRFGITPDLTTLGKIIGGGFPVGCYGGRKDIMEHIAPCGGVYQAGTLSGNPVAMAAGLATLKLLKEADYQALEDRVVRLTDDLAQVFADKKVPATINRMASMFTIFFTDGPVTDYASASRSDGERYAKFYAQMRDAGVYLAPSGYECAMTSFAHTEEDFAKVLDAARSVSL